MFFVRGRNLLHDNPFLVAPRKPPRPQGAGKLVKQLFIEPATDPSVVGLCLSVSYQDSLSNCRKRTVLVSLATERALALESVHRTPALRELRR